jgi:hypothetical protein
MKKKPATPAPEQTPEQALERMREFTRRIISVPKTAIVKPKKMLRKHR